MARLKKQLIVVGDRVLIRPEEGEERTQSGLYLPQTAVSARMAQGGWVVAVGPGLPIAEPVDLCEESWREADEPRARYVPLQAQEGDYALFLRKAAVEITFEKQQYLIVPNSAILVLAREGWSDDGLGLQSEASDSDDAASAGGRADEYLDDEP
ncbi:MAG: co-chaperone GroES family protein [bacterium]